MARKNAVEPLPTIRKLDDVLRRGIRRHSLVSIASTSVRR